jgi:outer membrane protein assembly factor BamA
VTGGNKSLLFNVEQNINIAGPVRLILFADAGEVRDVGQSFTLKETLKTPIINTSTPGLVDASGLSPFLLTAPIDCDLNPSTCDISRVSAFKVSTGAEVRFFMPVLNVPFRLIFAYNPARAGVLDSNLQPQQAFQFRFAVGSTF